MAETERIYRIVADGSQALNALNKLSDSTARLDSGMSAIGKSISVAVGAFSGLATVKGLAGIVRATEQVQTLVASLSTLRGSAELGADMMSRVFTVVGNTGASLDDVASSVQRLSIGMQELGANNAQIQTVAESFIKLGKIGGTSMQDVSGALVQFTQALSSGALQGDEFKSLSERMPLLMKALAKELNVSAGELKKMGSEGKITADVLANTLLKLGPQIQEDFAKLPVTFEQGMNKLKLTTTKFLAEVGKTSELMEAVSLSIDYINKGLSDMSSSASFIGIVAKTLKVVFQAAAVVASDLGFIVSGIVSDVVRLGRVAAALATGDFAKIPEIWSQVSAEQAAARVALDDYQAKIMGAANSMKEAAESAGHTHEKVELLGKSTGLVKATKDAKRLKEELTPIQQVLTDLFKQGQAKMVATEQLEYLKNLAPEVAAAWGLSAEEIEKKMQDLARSADPIGYAFKEAADKVREAALDRELDEIIEQMEKLEAKDPFKLIIDGINEMYKGVRETTALREALDDLYFSGKITGEEFEAMERKFNLTFGPASKPHKNVDEMTQAIKNLAAQGVGQLVDVIFSADKGFKEFARNFLTQIAKMIASQRILNALKGSSFGRALGFAHGGAFSGSTGLPYGVYDKPTYFTMPGSGPLKKFAQGGVLGERYSPEAILPLKRLASGDLGVQALAAHVSVNVVNNAGADVQVSQDGSNVDIVINRVANDILRGGGKVAQAMERAYGMSRARGAA